MKVNHMSLNSKYATALCMTSMLGLTGTAEAEIYRAYLDFYSVTAADFDGSDVTVYVQDLYLASNDTQDTVLNVYNFNFRSSAGNYFQSFTGTGWKPTNLGGPFDTPALRQADSFVTIGGFEQDTFRPEQSPGAGSGTGLDPNFGGNDAAYPGQNAGWYNGSPPNLNGAVGRVTPGSEIFHPDEDGFVLGLFIGRFASLEPIDTLINSTLEVTWNQGLGTPGQQQGFIITPAPGALALLGLAGFAGRRRRG